ncbi:hypothetical protein E1A91_D04G122500v1 [Gossypium mustelinum]|uniref:RNA-binding S4 domain-containing protein n=1 Tax=Gossypium mustelinum TaxID=34275 RepID=A0A5D2VD56_GOSMU|nr:hypothetical protein E1A91_D04G122500v1 [Gossypium mustelinum]
MPIAIFFSLTPILKHPNLESYFFFLCRTFLNPQALAALCDSITDLKDSRLCELDLIDVQKFSNRGVDLYIRLPSSKLDKGNSEIIVITTVISGMVVIIIIFALFLLRRMGQQRGVESLKSGSIDERGDKEAPKPSSGPHKLRECLPLILILRNRLKYALTYREVIAILMQRHVMVDGKVRTDKTYPVGFMGKRINHCRENKLSGFHDQCFSGFTLNEQETSQQPIGIEQSKFRIK